MSGTPPGRETLVCGPAQPHAPCRAHSASGLTPAVSRLAVLRQRRAPCAGSGPWAHSCCLLSFSAWGYREQGGERGGQSLWSCRHLPAPPQPCGPAAQGGRCCRGRRCPSLQLSHGSHTKTKRGRRAALKTATSGSQQCPPRVIVGAEHGHSKCLLRELTLLVPAPQRHRGRRDRSSTEPCSCHLQALRRRRDTSLCRWRWERA